MRFFILILAAILVGCSTTEQSKKQMFFVQGNQALENGNFEEAIEHYTNAIQVDKDFARAYNNRGVAYIESGDAHQAILDYNHALVIDGNYEECRLNRAYAYEKIGQFENSLKDISKLVSSTPDSAYLHFYEGLILTHLRRYPEAISSFDRSIDLGNYDLEALVNIATLHYLTGQYDSAQYFLDVAFEQEPNQPNALNTLSQIYLVQEEYQSALYAIERALEIVPREPYFLNNRGLILMEMDSLERGLEDINQSIVLNPQNGWAYRNKGIYHMKKAEYEKALGFFDRALQDREFVDEVYYYMGLTHELLGDGKACDSWGKGAKMGERRSKEALKGCS